MHVLVATDGRIDPEEAAAFAAPLAGPAGRVTVMTVVEIPRRLLDDLRDAMGQLREVAIDSDAEYVTPPPAPVVAGSSEPATETPRAWPGDDAMIARYLEDKRIAYTEPVVEALRARGVAAEGIVEEGENAAGTILRRLDELGADVIVIGAHGQGYFEGLLGSTGTKVVRRSPKPVLVLKV